MSAIKENPLITDLVSEKTSKLDSRLHFFGNCDELSCHIMEIRSIIEDEEIREELLCIVKELSIVMGEIALGKTKLEISHLDKLNELIRKYEKNNGILLEFVLPGQNLISSKIHITRCVARRTELTYAIVYNEYNTSKIIFEYLNKLSTFLYALALKFES